MAYRATFFCLKFNPAFLLVWVCACVLAMLPQPAFANNLSSNNLASLLGVDGGLLTGVFVGIICASFIYLLTTSVVIRDRSQSYLVLMLLAMIAHVLADNGFLNAFHKNPTIIEFIRIGALLLFFAASFIFAEQYLELDTRRSLLRFLLRACAVVLILLLCLSAIDTLYFARLMPWVSFASVCVLVLVGLVAFFSKTFGTIPFILAFSVMLLGRFWLLLMDKGLLTIPLSAHDITAITFATGAMLFAVVIAAQFMRRQEIKEQELARSNERFKMAALGANEGLFDWDIGKRTGYFSNRLNRLIGVNLSSEKRNPLRRWYQSIHPDDRAGTRHALFQFLRDSAQTTLNVEYRIKRFDGRTAWVNTTIVSARDRSGKAIRLVGSVGDITPRKRAEFHLKASEKRFRSIAEAHPVPVLITTIENGEVLYASEGTNRALRVSPSQLTGLSIGLFFEDGRAFTTLIESIRTNGNVDMFETSLIRGDKTILPAALSARVIDYERRPCAVIGIYDLTERRQAETKIRDTEAALLQSEKLAALGGLLAGVAHELNNPLSVVVGQAVLMRETSKDEKTAQRADKIQKAGERCSRIVRSFLALARRKPAERMAMRINEIIENSIELLAFQLRTDNVALVRKMDATLPPVFADPDQMTQVITNLVINAKQAQQDQTEPRSIIIETRLEKDKTGNENVVVSVTDNGTGVPPEILHRIFEPFFTTKPAGSGTGVGLSLCHSIIESHGGRIWVENAAPRGARFIFTLAAGAQNMAEDNLNAMTTNTAQTIPPQRILIVDDEVELAQTLADILTPDSHIITIVHNGKEALAALNKNEFDIIISDLRMPVMDGPTLYRTLEKDLPRYSERIIFVTGDTLSTFVSEFLGQYAIDVIEKPYTPSDVRRALAARVTEIARTNLSKKTKGESL